MVVERKLEWEKDAEGTLRVRVGGDWRVDGGIPAFDEARTRLGVAAPKRLVFDASAVGSWDSSLVAYLVGVAGIADEYSVRSDLAGLPSGLRRLLELARAVPEKRDVRTPVEQQTFRVRLGRGVLASWEGGQLGLAFVGESALSIGRFLQGRARFRRSDLLALVEDCGAKALPIVTLISFLVGLILAFVGAVQLQQFGAQIYVANLVGIAMLREMGAMMAAIIMAGRTGAAFAAQLGTMKVTQEIDALRTMGISPIDFLVLPRLAALCLMMPLLALYADLVGIVGGAVVGVTMLDISPDLYFDQTVSAVGIADFVAGLLKSAVFGILIAVAGCLRGMECGSSSSAVGEAATSAVVTGIVWIILADAFFTVLFNIVGF